MNELLERYRGKKTGTGHDIRVDERRDGITLWYLHWGEYQGVEAHHHLGIARVKCNEQGYWLGAMRGLDRQPVELKPFSSLELLCSELDRLIAAR
jgi:hypothetical protein